MQGHAFWNENCLVKCQISKVTKFVTNPLWIKELIKPGKDKGDLPYDRVTMG